MIYKSTPLLDTKEEEYSDEETLEIEEKWRKESARRRASLERRIRSWERRKHIWERREEFEQKEKKNKGTKRANMLCFNLFRGKQNRVIKAFLESLQNTPTCLWPRDPLRHPDLPRAPLCCHAQCAPPTRFLGNRKKT
ncbi:hypothetical protein E2C01_071534 [Portunus trituberculatus]|uniref:Uncharacterized protein n=1 Tax=Portunus trituberculatus TaxID=210409 RepID=A0A5B7I5D2_PORTR|nr:hypothetical protein [Portunus trituberculatus]